MGGLSSHSAPGVPEARLRRQRDQDPESADEGVLASSSAASAAPWPLAPAAPWSVVGVNRAAHSASVAGNRTASHDACPMACAQMSTTAEDGSDETAMPCRQRSRAASMQVSRPGSSETERAGHTTAARRHRACSMVRQALTPRAFVPQPTPATPEASQPAPKRMAFAISDKARAGSTIRRMAFDYHATERVAKNPNARHAWP